MPTNAVFFFGPYRLDPQNEQLWRDQQVVRLTGKAWAVLRYLLERPHQLVSRSELFQAVWPNTIVSQTTLTSCIKELRKALADEAKAPRYIETVHRRGYRFIAPVTRGQAAGGRSHGEDTSPQTMDNGQQAAIALPPPPPHPQPLTAPFVGREQEMAALRTSLENVLAGRGQLILLVGEPGIGKTRTAEEVALYARSRQARVYFGRCYEGEGAPPFWPWVQIVRSYLADQDPATVRRALGSGAAAIAQVIPDVHAYLPDLPPPPTLEPQPARFRFFESFTAFLKQIATTQPLVLLLDDLHWADTPSLLLLQFVARELSDARLLVLGTYRDTDVAPPHPLTQVLGELVRGAGSQSLCLRPFTASEVAHFLEQATAQTPASSLVTAIWQTTGGNPFFVTEVVHTLLQEGQVDQWENRNVATLPLPQRVRAAVERRLSGLSELCRQVLTTAAVIGRTFEFPVLAVTERALACSLTEDALLTLLDEAVAARFVVPTPRSIGRYSFAHALVPIRITRKL